MAGRIGRRIENQMVSLAGIVALVPLIGIAYFLFQDHDGVLLRLHPVSVAAGLAASILFTFFAVRLALVWVLRRRLKLLDDMEDVTRRLGRGEYAERIDAEAANEFASLGHAFNEMAEQLETSFQTSQAVADIDRLILSSAGLEPVIRRVLASAKIDTGEISLILRPLASSVRLATYRLQRRQLVEDSVGLAEVSEDSLKDIDGYYSIAERLGSERIRECLPIASDGVIAGVLVASGPRVLSAAESKRLTDLSERLSVALTSMAHSDSLYEQAHFDSLTGLINRHAFEDKLQESVSRSWRGEHGAVLFIDLDGFKKVNDTEGHKAGDRLLVSIGDRLRDCLREVDTIARLGGDEFAVIVPGCGDEKSVSKLCERIVSAIVKPIVVERMEHAVGASIGVALFPDDGQNVEELVMKADSAMYRAKESGGAKFAFFDDSLNEANHHRVLVESRLRKALQRESLELHFQPKLRLTDRSVDSAEALMRWNDAALGAVEPATFVPIAEETNLIHAFTEVLISKTADLMLEADRIGVRLDHVAINVSAKQLMTEGFALTLLSTLDRRNLPHHNIEIEVTESVFVKDTRLVVHELEILRSAGVLIALDDFGTGYSSLNMLRELPLDVVKIDRSFITELEASDQARILVQHIISIADALGKTVVAEGVETEVQLQHLVDANCHYAQGFLISKAKSQPEFLRLVADWQKVHAKVPIDGVTLR